MKKIYFLIGTLAVFLLGACHEHAHNEGHAHSHTDEKEVHEEHAHGEHDVHEGDSKTAHADEIVLSQEKAKSAGLLVDTLRPGVFRQIITTSGQVLVAQGDETTVVASMAGVVTLPRTLSIGTPVKRGSALLTLSSDKLQDGNPVQRARVAYQTAKAEYERAKGLAEKQIVTRKELEALKAAYEDARLAYEALAPNQTATGVAVAAPIAGYVKNILIKKGDYVAVGQPLMTLTQNRRLQLRAEVSERYYGALNQITSANFKTPYDNKVYSLEELNGKMLAYGKASDDAVFYIPVTFEFDNAGDIIPGSFVEVSLLGAERQGVLTLPSSAITEEQGLYFVYLQIDGECYRKQEVKLGADDGKRVEILSGIEAGDKVVVQGAYHVKLASAGNAIPAHSHSH